MSDKEKPQCYAGATIQVKYSDTDIMGNKILGKKVVIVKVTPTEHSKWVEFSQIETLVNSLKKNE